MRKIKLQMQVSIDGFVCGPNGEMDFTVWNWDDELKNYVKGLMAPADSFIIGRVLYEGMSMYWPAAETNPETSDEDRAAAKAFNSMPKHVFTKTLTTADWNNAIIESGDLIDTITTLKNREGGDIMLYGGVSLVSSFIEHNLIDEYHLFVNPNAIGKGRSIFGDLTEKFGFQLVNSSSFSCGIVVLHYVPAK
ncbi:dihydrofolate reductase family protein [Emticicia sp. BO119]|uniref:dihydrofolate reductase family protein n=1 Tax=Emticicia sp. BO119 TaxID=2757768 RepID=UPI0015F101D9|nr:dihydrofolate reductase family protein [Emticicia sp. BO119]MBA4853076.1 dihydrofolate reductase family protein [Emticicia sp. BO119]